MTERRAAVVGAALWAALVAGCGPPPPAPPAVATPTAEAATAPPPPPWTPALVVDAPPSLASDVAWDGRRGTLVTVEDARDVVVRRVDASGAHASARLSAPAPIVGLSVSFAGGVGAVTTGTEVLRLDLARGALARVAGVAPLGPAQVAPSGPPRLAVPTSRGVLVIGEEGAPRAIDASTAYARVAWSADGRAIAAETREALATSTTTGQRAPKVVVFDAATSTTIGPPRAGELVGAADGGHVVLTVETATRPETGAGGRAHMPTEVVVYRARLDDDRAADRAATFTLASREPLALAPDGRSFVARVDHASHGAPPNVDARGYGAEPLVIVLASGAERALRPDDPARAPRSVRWSDDGAHVAITLEDGAIEARAAATGAVEATIAGTARPVAAAALSPDGAQLATIEGAALVVRELDGGRVTGAIRAEWPRRTGEAPARAMALTWSPDGRRVLVSAQRDRPGSLAVASVTGEPKVVPLQVDGARAAAFTPDGALVAASDSKGHVGLFSAATGARLAWLTEDRVAINAIAVARGVLATGSDRGVVRVHRLDGDGDRARIGPARDLRARGPVWQLAYTVDGRRLAVAWGGGADAVDAATLGVLATLDARATVVAWSPDGAILAAASPYDPAGAKLVALDVDARGALGRFDSPQADALTALDGARFLHRAPGGGAEIVDVRSGAARPIATDPTAGARAGVGVDLVGGRVDLVRLADGARLHVASVGDGAVPAGLAWNDAGAFDGDAAAALRVAFRLGPDARTAALESGAPALARGRTPHLVATFRAARAAAP